MTDIVVGKTVLNYVGSRPYIRGADLYGWFERQITVSMKPAEMPAVVRQFRLVREVERDGAWTEGLGSDASATVETADSSGTVRRFSFHETGEIITARVPDIPSNVRKIERQGDFAGRAVLAGPRSMVDLLNGLIEVNKCLHAETLATRGVPADRIRLIFIESLPIETQNGADRVVEFRHLGERRAPGRTYTLNAVRIDQSGGELRICYSY